MFKIGDYIKVKKEYDQQIWYVENMMKIIEVKDSYYIMDKDYFRKLGYLDDYYNRLSHDKAYQDKECIKKYRKRKIKRLLE